MLRLPYRVLLLTLLCSTRLYCQPTNVRLSVRQAAKIADSLAVLPFVRREAAAWQRAAEGYHAAADSLRAADAHHRAAYQQEQVATARLGVLLGSSAAAGTAWKATARKRGMLNGLLLAGLGGLGYFTLTH